MHTELGSSFFLVQNFEFQYILEFSEKIHIFGGRSMKFCGSFLGVITKIGLRYI